MEKTNYLGYPLVISAAFIIALVAFSFCIVAEVKKSKAKDVKLDGNFCYLPGSTAYGFGLSALLLYATAQTVGNLALFLGLDAEDRKSWASPSKAPISTAFVALSWLSFVIVLILLGSATSMSIGQAYGKGWLNGECYLVKDGIFAGAAVLILFSLGCTSASALTISRKEKLQVSADSDEMPQKIIE